jgi:hypothetical protein
MSGNTYSAEHNVSSAAQLDVFELVAPADAVIQLISFELGQDSEEADAQAEMLGAILKRAYGSYTSGSGGETGGAKPKNRGAAASGATVEKFNTTQAAAGLGTLEDLEQFAFNLQIGLLYQPTPEEYWMISPGEALVLSLSAAPTDSVDWKMRVTWKELGG